MFGFQTLSIAFESVFFFKEKVSRMVEMDFLGELETKIFFAAQPLWAAFFLEKYSILSLSGTLMGP